MFAALEFATGCNAIVTGKPDPAFFRIGLDSLGLGMEQDAFHKNDEKFDKTVSNGIFQFLQKLLFLPFGKKQPSWFYYDHDSI